ncbi:hypothetical protein DEU38_103134 [Rhodococcus sp. AG1013]|uniref:hypothetical protein n=1 Tax=Rhodococcus sp. AG1013 TaxID=2183996 RepID=UPI000E0AECAA|nr:hypothetical protein [Rhodococcus sp. AG1013]RDI32401.1 hypothetical protein DEU38_103134 [Rhodococcus sp. AG1013]
MSNDYVWKLNVEYPLDALHPDDAPWFAGHLRSDWAPPGWDPDGEYIDRFKTERFIWPSVRKFYLSRSAAVDRALLLEHYDAKVRLLRSVPLTFEERPFKRPLRLIAGGAV